MGFEFTELFSTLAAASGGFISAGTAILAARRTKKIDREWESVAARRGLRFKKSKGLVKRELRGKIEGYTVCVEHTKAWGGKEAGTFTRASLRYPAHGTEFKVARTARLSRIAIAAGREPIRTGDEEFDGHILLTGEDPPEVLDFFTPERRTGVLRLLARFPHCVLHDGSIALRVRIKMETAGQIDEILDRFLMLARLLAPSAAFAPFAPSMPTRPVVHTMPPPLRAPPPLLVPLGEERLVPDATLEPIPDEEDELAPAREANTEVDADLLPMTTMEEACAALFAESRMGSETRRIFEERFLDHLARGSGTLLRIEGHSSPATNGRGPQRVAVLELPDPGASEFGSRPVRAMVSIPEEEAARLQTLLGTALVFEGRLVDCNPYLRDLHLEGTVRAI